MKHLKKAASILLTLAMILTMTVTSFAAETGSITINGVSDGNTYEIYQLLDLESYNKTTGAYSYKATDAWKAFFDSDTAKQFFSTDADGYVTWTWTGPMVNPYNSNETITAETEATAIFARLALDYAKGTDPEHPVVSPVKSSENDGEFVITEDSGKFTNLNLGYYLVDSSVGALCGLTTTNPDASVNAKNGQPTIDKQVKEDSTEQWGDSNTADVGQTVEFRATINVHAGAENYVLHDNMSAGLTFQGVSKIEHVIPGKETHVTDPAKYTVVTEGLTDGCTFEVRFTKAFCDSLEANDKVIVYYNAMLNRNAIVAGDGNPNEVWLDYGEGNHSTHDTTTTKTFGIDIVKTDSQNTLIDGAQFKIYDAATGGNEVPVVLMDDGVTYRRARTDETGVEIVVKDGMVRVVGFDNGTYYLEETVAPDGYNKLTTRQKFIIGDANLDATFNDGVFSTNSGVHVVNKTGSILPETGGMGTVMFITCGSVLVMAAGVLLVTKKRMSMIED